MIPIKSAHDKEALMRVEKILAESRDKREAMLRIQKQINVILGTIQIDCGINDKEKFLFLLERIAGDHEIVSHLNTLIRSGVRIWVNYGGLMKRKCQIDQDGSLMIADNASLDNIRAYLGILPF